VGDCDSKIDFKQKEEWRNFCCSSFTSEERADEGVEASTTFDDDHASVLDNQRLPTPRCLLNNNEETDSQPPPTKKSQRSTQDMHAAQAQTAKRKRVKSLAMKVVTSRVNHNNNLAKNNPNEKSINFIVDEINKTHGSNLSPQTVGRCVRQGMIGISPMKKGPTGDVPRAMRTSLNVAFATFLQLEQSESKAQSALKHMALWVNQCTNEAGHNKQGDDLTKKLKRDTADLFDCSNANVMEQRCLQWITCDNLKVWCNTWKETVIDLGFGRE